MSEVYLELPHMLPVTVRGSEDQVWIEQPGADDEVNPDAVLIHEDQVPDVIDALKRYLKDRRDARPSMEDTLRRIAAASG